MMTERLRVGYLAGSGHTGSTLVALLMDTHPQVASIGETAFTPPAQRRGDARQICSCGESYCTCPFWAEVFRAVNQDGFEFSPYHWSNDYRFRNPWLHRLLTRYSSARPIRYLQNLAADVLPLHGGRLRRVDEVNVSFIRAVLRAARADVFFDSSKRPLRLRQFLKLRALDVKVVRLVRDVRGYAASAKRRGVPIEDAARAWHNDRIVIDEITRSLPRDQTMLLRYEDLCGDPSTTLRAVHTFLGVKAVDPPAVVRPREHHVLGNRIRLQERLEIRVNDAWKRALSGQEIARILRVAGEANQRLGYV
jgi:hypothetical protein